MRYLLLLYGDAQAEDALGEEGRRRIVDEHGRFTQRLRERGAYVHADPLTGGSAAKIVRRDGEGPIVTDGPFAETKEQLGGFYVIEAEAGPAQPRPRGRAAADSGDGLAVCPPRARVPTVRPPLSS
jgi:hypothetical protein